MQLAILLYFDPCPYFYLTPLTPNTNFNPKNAIYDPKNLENDTFFNLVVHQRAALTFGQESRALGPLCVAYAPRG